MSRPSHAGFPGVGRDRWARRLTAAALLTAAATLLPRHSSDLPRHSSNGATAGAPRPSSLNRTAPIATPAAPRDAAGDLLATFTRLDTLAATDADPATLFDAYWSALERTGALDGKNFDAIRALLETTPRADVRALLLAAFADIWARTEPAEAATWVATFPALDSRLSTIDSVMTTWSARDPAAAAAFAASLPPGDLRRAALGSVTLQWREIDFPAAAAWVTALADSRLSTLDSRLPDIDPALAALATAPRLVSTDPAAAIRWAEQIANPETRREAIATIARQWAVTDATAPSVPDSSHLTPAQRAWLTEVLIARRRDGGS